jgi:predicted metallo-beta-lactamase superfamily hydrolase
MAPIFRAGEEHDVSVLTAAEFAGQKVDQLEANRDRLYGIESPPKGISGPASSET